MVQLKLETDNLESGETAHGNRMKPLRLPVAKLPTRNPNPFPKPVSQTRFPKPTLCHWRCLRHPAEPLPGALGSWGLQIFIRGQENPQHFYNILQSSTMFLQDVTMFLVHVLHLYRFYTNVPRITKHSLSLSLFQIERPNYSLHPAMVVIETKRSKMCCPMW